MDVDRDRGPLGSAISRRRLLRAAAIGFGSSVAFFGLPGSAIAKRDGTVPPVRTKAAFRLSTHRRQSCTACKRHAANRFFATADAVERAHPGCNCRVVAHPLPVGVWFCMFRNGTIQSYDVRSGRCPVR